MARPQKNNADYISHDVGMRNHRKVKALRSKFGIEGYAVWCMMLEYLGSCDFFEARIDSVEREILSGDFEVSCDRLQQIVEYLLQIGMLQKDGEIYKSQSLIDRLTPMIEKRDRERARIPVAETDRMGQDVAEMHQSKVKETKEEESKENEITSSKEEQPKAEYGNKEINDLLEIIKQACSKNGLIYSGKGDTERNAAKRLLSKKFSKTISEFGMDIETFVNNVIMVSTRLKFNTKQVTSAKLIYYNREEIVNKAKQQKLVTEKVTNFVDLTDLSQLPSRNE